MTDYSGMPIEKNVLGFLVRNHVFFSWMQLRKPIIMIILLLSITKNSLYP
jgi:hypothetical protein